MQCDDGCRGHANERLKEHLRADLSRALHTPLYLPDDLFSQHAWPGPAPSLPLSSIPRSIPTPQGPPLAAPTPLPVTSGAAPSTAPSSPELLRRALADVCLAASPRKRSQSAQSVHVSVAQHHQHHQQQYQQYQQQMSSSSSARSWSFSGPSSLPSSSMSSSSSSSSSSSLSRPASDGGDLPPNPFHQLRLLHSHLQHQLQQQHQQQQQQQKQHRQQLAPGRDRSHSCEQIPEETAQDDDPVTAPPPVAAGPGPSFPQSTSLQVPDNHVQSHCQGDEIGSEGPRRASESELLGLRRKELSRAAREEARRRSTGVLEGLDLRTARRKAESARAATTVDQQQGFRLCGVESNYHTYPPSRPCTCGAVRDLDEVLPPAAPSLGQPGGGAPSSKGVATAGSGYTLPPRAPHSQTQPGYATYPPMNPAACGLVRARPPEPGGGRPKKEGLRLSGRLLQPSAMPSAQQSRAGDRCGSMDSCSYASTPSSYTPGSSGDSWSSVVKGDGPSAECHVPGGFLPSAHHPPRGVDLPSYPSSLGPPSGHPPSAPLAPLSFVEFLHLMMTSSPGHACPPYPQPAFSPAPGPGFYPPGPCYPPGAGFTLMAFLPHLPAFALPMDLRGKPVRYAPLGRYLFDLLNKPGQGSPGGESGRRGSSSSSHEQRGPGGISPLDYLAKMNEFSVASTIRGSWQGLTDLIRMQGLMLHQSQGQGQGNPNCPRPTQQHNADHSHSMDYISSANSFSSPAHQPSYASVATQDRATNAAGRTQTSGDSNERCWAPERVFTDCDCRGACGCGRQFSSASSVSSRDSLPTTSTIQSECAQGSASASSMDVRRASDPGAQRLHNQLPGNVSHVPTSNLHQNRPRTSLQDTPSNQPQYPPQNHQNLPQKPSHNVPQNPPTHAHQNPPTNHPSRASGEMSDRRPQAYGRRSEERCGTGSRQVSEEKARAPFLAPQDGSSEEMTADFLLFCSALQSVCSPAQHLPGGQGLAPGQGGFPFFPNFDPDWFRLLPDFPQ